MPPRDPEKPGRREKDYDCLEHDAEIEDLYSKYGVVNNEVVAMKASANTGRYALGVFGGICLVVLSFASWVANDNLSNIRMELKETKGLMQSYQIEVTGVKKDIEAIKRDMSEAMEHVHSNGSVKR